MSPVEDEIVAITGHRYYPDRAALYRGLDSMKARQYYFGGAQGVDTDALEHIARTQPGSVRTVVVPNRAIDQPVSTRVITERYATNVIELRNSGPDRFMIRNRYMVDNSTRVNAFYDFRGKGGTFNTIEYSRSIGRPLKVHPLREFDIEEFRGMSKGRFHTWMKQMKSYKVNLSNIKMIIVNVIIKIFHMSVGAFFQGLGYVGVKSVEGFWSY